MIKSFTIYKTIALLLITTASICLSSLHATEMEGDVSIGLMNFSIDQANSNFGKYTGISDDANRLLAEFKLKFNPSEKYLSMTGNNLGLDNRSIEINGGHYGRYGISFKHSELTTLTGVNAQTPYENTGSSDITLPSGFIDGVTTEEMTTLDQQLKRLDVSINRKNSRLILSVTPDELWNLSLSINRERQDGIKPLGAPVGNLGRWGYPTTILPAPVNQTTDNIMATVGYNDSSYQWQVKYHWSRFNNYFDSIRWDNPFSSDNNTDDPSIYPDRGLTSLAPDNSYQNITINSAFNMPMATRLVMTGNFSRMKQDGKMLGYTINQGSNITTPLSRDSSAAKVDTSRIHLKLSSRPISRLSLTTSYDYDRRNNKTPSTLFLRVTNDHGDQAQIDDIRASYNHPFDMSRKRIKVAGRYYLGRGTSLKLAHQQENVERSKRAVAKTVEKSQTIKLRSRFSSKVSANFGLQRDRRRADSGYDNDRAYRIRHTTEYIDTVADNERFDNNPKLRQYDIADRNRDKVRLNLNLYPNSNTTVALYYNKSQAEYPDSSLGLGSNDQDGLTLDINYSPQDKASLFAYYTREKGKFRLDGTSFNSAGPPGTKFNTANDPDNFWQVNNSDDITTLALGGSFTMLREDLQLKAKIYQSNEKSRINFISGANLTATDLPQDNALRRGIELKGEYAFSYNIDIGLGLMYEKYRIDNWSRDGIEPGSSSVEELITLLAPEPDYTAYTLYIMLRFRW